MEKCRRLWEYSEFIAEVNDNLDQKMSPKAAITRAMDHCIQNGILEELLRKNQAEVLHMLLTEYDEKEHMKSIYEEGEEAGYLKGYSKGESDLLLKQVRPKLDRGKSIPEIAEELETEEAVIEEIVERIKNLP